MRLDAGALRFDQLAIEKRRHRRVHGVARHRSRSGL
jgi:hypothetical protein